MNPTNEQIHAMYEGARQEHDRRGIALRKCLDAFAEACAGCWMNAHDGCEHANCSIWRMWNEHSKVQRMRGKEKLDAWEWYAEAKNNNRLLFIDAGDAGTTTDTNTTTAKEA